MAFPKSFRTQFLKQIDALISEGEALRKSLKFVPERTEYHDNSRAFLITQRAPTTTVHPAHYTCDPEPMQEWLIRCTSLLESIIPSDHIHYSRLVMGLSKMYPNADAPKNVLPILRAISKDFDSGAFDPIADRLQAAFASDYLSQAQELLDLKSRDGVDHVPAAVLAGAVLERHLREMCVRRSIAILRPNGDHIMMDDLITNLRKAPNPPFENPMAAELRGWAAIRNKAAHGEFDKFTRDGVQRMLTGITDFLNTYQ